jgi:hypothetical protein
MNEQDYLLQELLCLIAIILTALFQNDFIDFGMHAIIRILTTNFGIGCGHGKENVRISYHPKNIWKQLTNRELKKKTHLTKKQFNHLVLYINRRWDVNASVIKYLDLEERILITLYWIMKYEDYDTMVALFGVSEFVISRNITETLPYLVEFFMQFIPNYRISSLSSTLSSHLVFIIDGTPHHKTRPRFLQDLDFNGNEHCHSTTTLLLIDYGSWICAFTTNIHGHTHDVVAARNNPLFERIIGDLFALGDPGFQVYEYVLAGLKPTEIKTEEQLSFYCISKAEQRAVEHVNNFFKKCKSVA